MAIKRFCQQTMESMARTKRSIISTIAQQETYRIPEARLVAMLSDVSAAMQLMSYQLNPGDIIVFAGSLRCRILDTSNNGLPMGQAINKANEIDGAAFVLRDWRLSNARKEVIRTR